MTMNKQLYINELIHESSPYLLEHAHNPVNWYPWGKKALEKAKQENKPLIISIGYAACHWCHVMEHQSYSDLEVANIMNQHFVAIKVDREERPDIDQIYMNASMLVNGNGGWPLNAFALPDGRPFYAGTYFPKSQWIGLLEKVIEAYRSNYNDLVTQAESLTQGINSLENFVNTDPAKDNLHDIYHQAFQKVINTVDLKDGGFYSQQKFPLPIGWEFLLQYYYLHPDENILKVITKTLDRIAMGGIYDQIGGGFARYSTDTEWKVPHFEKMLYDNAQLVSLYSHAYQVKKKPLYSEVIRETLDFIKREMTTSDGGFYSSLNADSEGEEGRFYVWTLDEMDEVLEDNAALISSYFQVTKDGNWEHGKNILRRNHSIEKFAISNNMPAEAYKKLVFEAKLRLLETRNKRVKPTTDDKILTAWNSLMLKGYLDAFRALKSQEYLDAAIKNAVFIENNMVGTDGSLMRNFKNGKATIKAFLDDYAFLIRAFTDLYQVTFNIHWLHNAKKLTDYAILHFQDAENGLFYYTSDDSENLIARKMEISDNVIPSSNSTMAENLFALGELFENAEYTNLSKSMLDRIVSEIPNGGVYYANWAYLLGFITTTPYEIAIMGKNAITVNQQLQEMYLPSSLFMGGAEENLPLLGKKQTDSPAAIYVCRNKTCDYPVDSVEKAVDLIRNSN